MTRRFGLSLFTALILAAGASPAQAWDMKLSSTTYARGYVRPGSPDLSQHLAFYELVNLRARDLGLRGLSLTTSAWGNVQALDLIDDRATGDVDILALEYSAPADSILAGLMVTAGRQLVALGPSILEQLDGGTIAYRSAIGLDVALFGGAVTGVRFTRQPWPQLDDDDAYGYNWVLGGRLGYRFRDIVAIGASYRHKRFGDEVAFNEVGWDLLVMPLDSLELLSNGAVELTSGRLKEARAGLRFTILDDLEAGAGYRFVTPDLYIPRSSIFAVFSDQENQQAYVETFWSPLRWLDLAAEVDLRIYGETCTNGTIGGEACDDNELEVSAELTGTLRLGPRRQRKLAVEVERVGAPDGGYTRVRAGASSPLFWRLSAMADLDVYMLDAHDHGGASGQAHEDTSYGIYGRAYLSMAILDGLSIMAGGGGMTSPQFTRAGSFMVRLRWDWEMGSASDSSAAASWGRPNSAAPSTGGVL